MLVKFRLNHSPAHCKALETIQVKTFTVYCNHRFPWQTSPFLDELQVPRVLLLHDPTNECHILSYFSKLIFFERTYFERKCLLRECLLKSRLLYLPGLRFWVILCLKQELRIFHCCLYPQEFYLQPSKHYVLTILKMIHY